MALEEMPTDEVDEATPVERSADTIVNPVTGERITFLKRAQETDGEFARIEVVVEPGAIGPPEHVHPRQEEFFRVLSGTFGGRVDGDEFELNEGEELTVWSGSHHAWWNAEDDEELRFIVEMRPAMQVEEFLETFHGLGRDGRTNDDGLPNPFQLAVFGQAYWNDVRVVSPPAIVQRVMYAVLAPIGRRLLGYKAYYPEYSPIDGKWSDQRRE